MVTMAQPCVPLFSLVAAHFLIPEEKFTFKKLIPNMFALVGTVMTALPSWTSSESANTFDYLLLTCAIASFGFGSVYVKTVNADPIICCAFQLLSSAVYTTIFAVTQFGYREFAPAFANLTGKAIAWSAGIGFVYTFTSSLLYVYVIRELGPFKAGFANFGQILIGTIAGVVFLHEWDGYSQKDVVISLFGIVMLVISLVLGFHRPPEKVPVSLAVL